jgi:hypothetical protein
MMQFFIRSFDNISGPDFRGVCVCVKHLLVELVDVKKREDREWFKNCLNLHDVIYGLSPSED